MFENIGKIPCAKEFYGKKPFVLKKKTVAPIIVFLFCIKEIKKKIFLKNKNRFLKKKDSYDNKRVSETMSAHSV